MNTEELALSMTLVVLGCGLAWLAWDLIRRRRRREEEESRPIDTSIFNQSSSAEALRSALEDTAPAAPAEDGLGFRRYTETDTLPEPKKPVIAYLEDGTVQDMPHEPIHETQSSTPIHAEPELEPVFILKPEHAPAPEPEPVSILKPEYASAPEPAAPAPVLICTHYGAGFGGKVVLADVSLEIPARGITTLMGPAGTGKSTLMRSLAGLYAQNALHKSWGEVSYRGAPLGVGNYPLLVAQRIQLTQRSALESLVFHLKEEKATASDEEQREWACQMLRQVGAEDIIPQLDIPFMDLGGLAQRIVTILREAVAASDLLMIDEPTTGLSTPEAEVLMALLRRLAESNALLVVLHNQKQARKISDRVILLAGGVMQEQASAEAFFSGNLQNPVVAQFLATGSCSVPSPGTPAEMMAEDVPPPPPLTAAAMAAIKSEVRAALAPAPTPTPAPEPAPAPPQGEQAAVKRYPGNSSGPRGFVWIEEGRLAATPMPGVTADVDYDLDLLKNVGITALITLTEKDFPQDALARHGLTNLHLSIEDRKAPTAAEMDMLVTRMRQMLESGEVLAVHCLAGLGRTGTILAAYLVKEKGLSAQSALNQIRRFNRQFVQSDDQEDFLMEYEVQNEQNLLRGRAGSSGVKS
ncbi:MAG: dual specificity protein phosphatase family protein [Acidocella sp.]|nr:dual specificity protein phosphatase family protein [Acidocella sp.]